MRRRPTDLWSLWEIMRPFHADFFLTAKGFLRNYATYDLLSPLGLVKDAVGLNRISKEHRRVYAGAWDSFRPFVAELNLVASVATIEKMLSCLADPDSTYPQYYALGAELEGRLTDEMKGRMFLSLSPFEANIYEQPTQGWEEIVERFPATLGDIEEARKCFALSRYPAAVFHSLQIVEIGVAELGSIAGATDPLPGWGSTRNRLSAILKKPYKDRTAFEKKHFAFFEQVSATIELLNSAWRNKVSHAAGKLTLLTAEFTPDIAEEILSATRSFMRRLATEGPSSDEGPS